MEAPEKQMLCPRHQQMLTDAGLTIAVPDHTTVKPRAPRAPERSQSDSQLLLFGPEPEGDAAGLHS